MAERLKHKLLEQEKLVDIVAGPDSYRDLPQLIQLITGEKQIDEDSSHPDIQMHKAGAMNVQLSLDETYADIIPVRADGARSAFVSVMRGCNNMCAFCIVPYTRGRERSRPVESVVEEVRLLSERGFKEVTLLGQNVNSFADHSSAGRPPTGEDDDGKDAFASVYARGFRSVYKPKRQGAVRFAELIERVADVDPEMRIRFTSPHPKDFPDELLAVIASRPNVCNQIHMPAQSGSSTCLERMNRGYTREAYLELVHRIRTLLPDVGLSSDFMTG
jgi:tRNA A37 methylthiotransferase MiaB